MREAVPRTIPNGWNTISCLKIIYCTERLRIHNNPHHFTLCVKYWGKIPKSQKWELIVLLLFTFSFANMASAISAPTHTVSYNRNKSIELRLIRLFVKSMGSFTRRAGGKSLWWGRHTFHRRGIERADENKRATTRSIFLVKCVKMPFWATTAHSKWIMEPQKRIQMRVINSWAWGGQTETHEAWLMKRHN